MDFIKELGPLAFGTRLKNFTDGMIKDLSRFYKDMDIDFEPRWFSIFQLLLKREGEIPVTKIAEELNQTHPAVIQVVHVLEQKGLVMTKPDDFDHRKRLISLTKEGKVLASHIAPLWNDIYDATVEFLNENQPDFLDIIDKLETELKKENIYDRVKRKTHERLINSLKISEYNTKDKEDFEKLNRDWLEEYLGITEYDIKVISDPERMILNKGGRIYLLRVEDIVIGCFAISPINIAECELQKFTVRKDFRGKGLGSYLLDQAIRKALELNYKNILLFSHEDLKEATGLYKKQGFRIIENHPDFADSTGRDSIMMTLTIN